MKLLKHADSTIGRTVVPGVPEPVPVAACNTRNSFETPCYARRLGTGERCPGHLSQSPICDNLRQKRDSLRYVVKVLSEPVGQCGPSGHLLEQPFVQCQCSTVIPWNQGVADRKPFGQLPHFRESGSPWAWGPFDRLPSTSSGRTISLSSRTKAYARQPSHAEYGAGLGW